MGHSLPPYSAFGSGKNLARSRFARAEIASSREMAAQRVDIRVAYGWGWFPVE
jgi:hypothetical protein